MPPRISSVTNGPGSHESGFHFTARVDMGDLPTLPDRMVDEFNKALVFHLEDAAQRVIDTARGYLVRLNEPAIKTNLEGKAIHGYDTGVMYVSLMYQLMTALLVTGVFYELLSNEAKYWRYMEFGFHTQSGDWWPGYHFLETAIEEKAGYIRQRVREAWADTAISLALQSARSHGAGSLGLTGMLNLPGQGSVLP